ncbi:hypothetical protein BKP45_19120 [Anaerobacillus alkalidiazotrophicus]|uniref:Uncharacterized protein n=1 Tax=Anaerobacillus alkalidiazotrophicus TaxID=472963 RepID=A0A1S2M1Q9_9BACI|nr:glycosyltransferase [Anaerobacillus alkalidiazotrophicus]OIJ18554.1 hypothetical protein BKP45_19120 [Anaerobacillus alkalidiazotrophicus]
MKILYIPSGFKRIYEYFDQTIMKELASLNHEVKSFNALLGVKKLQTMLQIYRPNLVLTMVGMKMRQEMITFLNKQSIPTAIWLTEDPFYIDRTLTFIDNFDYVFTIDTAALEVYHKNGHKNSYYLPLGVNPEIYSPPLTEPQKKYDLCLVGFPYPDRVQLINLLLERTTYSILVVGAKWDQELSHRKHNRRLFIINTWLKPKLIVSYYHQSKIILNTHRPYDLKENKNSQLIINKSVNNRTFEIACSGSFQLIDNKADLTDHFVEGEEIISFHNAEDFNEKIDYYLTQPLLRNTIATGARKKAIREHTFEKRLEKLLSIVQSN